MNHKNFRLSAGILLALAASGLGMQACGGDGTAGTSTTSGAGGAPSTTNTGATTTSSTGGAGGASGTSITVGVGGAGGAGGGGAGGATSSASGSSSSSGSSGSTGAGGGAACTETTLAAFKKYLLGNDSYATYSSIVSPDQGDPTSSDKLFFEFYGSSVNPSLNGELKGTFDLSAAGDSNYGTCSRCLFLVEDFSGTNRYFFQQSGSLVLDASSDQLNGTLNATLNDVTLVEVTVDSMGTSTPVPNGACRHLATTAVTVVPAVTPAAWTCDPASYGDNDCDCGCGALDVDCDDATGAVCKDCDGRGSCSVDSCPGTINPANNAVCTVM